MIQGLRPDSRRWSAGVIVSGCVGLLQYALQYPAPWSSPFRSVHRSSAVVAGLPSTPHTAWNCNPRRSSSAPAHTRPRLIIPSAIDPTRRGSGPWRGCLGGAPHRTNDLDTLPMVCSACPGSMAVAMIRLHLSHQLTLSTGKRSVTIPEPGAPRRKLRVLRLLLGPSADSFS